MGRTAPLTPKRCILYIYSTNTGTEYFKYALYSPFFPLQNAVCFIMLTCLVPVLFTFYIQGVLKLKKNNSGVKGLNKRTFSRGMAHFSWNILCIREGDVCSIAQLWWIDCFYRRMMNNMCYLLSSSSSSSPLCRVFILIFLKQTISLGNTVLQLFCCHSSWCLYR